MKQQMAILSLLMGAVLTSAAAQPRSHLNEAISLAVAAEYEEALKLFRLELAHHPEDPLRHYLVGMTEFKLENYSTAVGRFQAALEKHADFPQVYYWMARAYQELGKSSQALSTLQRGLNRFPYNEDLKSLNDLLR